MSRARALLVVAIAFAITGATSLYGAENVWSGLVIAENVAQPQRIPPELTRIEGSLKRFFGYNQFQRSLDPRQFRRNPLRSEEHTSELQSHSDLVCRLLLEKKKKKKKKRTTNTQ